MAHIGQKLALGPVGRLGRLTGLFKGLGRLALFRYIPHQFQHADGAVAVNKRQGHHVKDRAVRVAQLG